MRSFLQRSLQYLFIICFVCGLLLHGSTSTVQANSYAYKWILHFDFEDSFDGRLMMQVGKNDGNGGVVQPPLHQQSFAVPCKRNGAVHLAGGQAHFNGGYLECDFDLERALDIAFSNCQLIEPGCAMPIGSVEQYRSVALGAEVSTPTTGLTPILAHNSVALAVDVGSSTHAIESTFAPIGNTNSAPWSAIPPINTFYKHRAYFACSLAGDCGIQFNVAGNPEYVDTPDMPVDFQVPQTSIYIGRDLAGTVIAPGSMIAHAYVDPGNGLPD